MFIDTHAHLTDKKFDSDRREVLKKAENCGVGKIFCVLSDFTERDIEIFEEILRDGNIFGLAGVHPHEAKNFEELESKLKMISENKKVVALGEIGLDFHYMNSPQDIQIKVFQKQLELAFEKKLPVVLHIREAYPQAKEILKDVNGNFLLHSFSGNLSDAEFFLKRNFYFSFSGILTFKNAGNIRRTAKEIPLERVLFETDCPYLAPQKYRGKRNEPAFVKEIYETFAEIKGVKIEELKKAVLKNTENFFNLKFYKNDKSVVRIKN